MWYNKNRFKNLKGILDEEENSRCNDSINPTRLNCYLGQMLSKLTR